MSWVNGVDDLILALRLDTCEKLESCQPCKDLREQSIAALKRSLELEKQLRALAERMRENIKDLGTPDRSNPHSTDIQDEADEREIDVTRDYLGCIDSLLTAHGAEQASAVRDDMSSNAGSEGGR